MRRLLATLAAVLILLTSSVQPVAAVHRAPADTSGPAWIRHALQSNVGAATTVQVCPPFDEPAWDFDRMKHRVVRESLENWNLLGGELEFHMVPQSCSYLKDHKQAFLQIAWDIETCLRDWAPQCDADPFTPNSHQELRDEWSSSIDEWHGIGSCPNINGSGKCVIYADIRLPAENKDDFHWATSDSVPSGMVDGMSTIMHELGHVINAGARHYYDPGEDPSTICNDFTQPIEGTNAIMCPLLKLQEKRREFNFYADESFYYVLYGDSQ